MTSDPRGYFRGGAAVEALVLNRREEARRLFVFRDVSVFPSFTTTSTRLATTKTTLINRIAHKRVFRRLRDATRFPVRRRQSGEVPVIVRGGRRDFRSRDVRRRGGGNRRLFSPARGAAGSGAAGAGLGATGLGFAFCSSGGGGKAGLGFAFCSSARVGAGAPARTGDAPGASSPRNGLGPVGIVLSGAPAPPELPLFSLSNALSSFRRSADDSNDSPAPGTPPVSSSVCFVRGGVGVGASGAGMNVMSDATLYAPCETRAAFGADAAPERRALASHALSFPRPGAGAAAAPGDVDTDEDVVEERGATPTRRRGAGAAKPAISSTRSAAGAFAAAAPRRRLAPPRCTTSRLRSSLSISIFRAARAPNAPDASRAGTPACSRTYLNGAWRVSRTAAPFSAKIFTKRFTALSTSSAVGASSRAQARGRPRAGGPRSRAASRASAASSRAAVAARASATCSS